MYVSVAISLRRSSSEVYASGFKSRNTLQANTGETILFLKKVLCPGLWCINWSPCFIQWGKGVAVRLLSGRE